MSGVAGAEVERLPGRRRGRRVSAVRVRRLKRIRDGLVESVATALEGAAQAAHRLVEASVSPNTRRAYAGVLRRLDAWFAGRRLEDTTLAGYLAESTSRGEPCRAHRRQWPRRASGPVSPASRARPGNGPPRCWQTIGGGPPVRPRPGLGAPLYGGGLGGGLGRGPRHLPPAATSRLVARIRPSSPRARPARRRHRGAVLHGRCPPRRRD